MIDQKTVFGTRNSAVWAGAVVASGSCSKSLQTIVRFEFLRHYIVGCALRFFIFLEALKIFLKTILSRVGFASSLKNFGRVLACAVFNCASKCVG